MGIKDQKADLLELAYQTATQAENYYTLLDHPIKGSMATDALSRSYEVVCMCLAESGFVGQIGNKVITFFDLRHSRNFMAHDIFLVEPKEGPSEEGKKTQLKNMYKETLSVVAPLIQAFKYAMLQTRPVTSVSEKKPVPEKVDLSHLTSKSVLQKINYVMDNIETYQKVSCSTPEDATMQKNALLRNLCILSELVGLFYEKQQMPHSKRDEFNTLQELKAYRHAVEHYSISLSSSAYKTLKSVQDIHRDEGEALRFVKEKSVPLRYEVNKLNIEFNKPKASASLVRKPQLSRPVAAS